MSMPPQQHIIPDGMIATGALTTPIWLQQVEEAFAIYILVGGAALLTLRIIAMIRDFRKDKKED